MVMSGSWPGRFVDLPGRGRTYVRESAGPPGAPTVMLLHGLGATAQLNWAAAAGTLARSFRVVALDHRGHGRGMRTDQFTLEECADDVAALAEQLGTGRLILVGYSMGGPIAQLAWRRHPDLVAGLVLVATSRNFRGRQGERLGFLALGAVAAALAPPIPGARQLRRASSALLGRLPLVGDTVGPLPWYLAELARHDPLSVVQAAHATGRFTSHRWIDSVDVPTAVVATTKDRFVRSSRQVRMAMEIPTAVLHPLAEGHLGLLGAGSDASSQAVLHACEEVVWRARRHRHAPEHGGIVEPNAMRDIAGPTAARSVPGRTDHP